MCTAHVLYNISKLRRNKAFFVRYLHLPTAVNPEFFLGPYSGVGPSPLFQARYSGVGGGGAWVGPKHTHTNMPQPAVKKFSHRCLVLAFMYTRNYVGTIQSLITL